MLPGIGFSQSTPPAVEWDYDTPSTIAGFEDDDNWLYTTIQASDGSIVGVGFSDKYNGGTNSTTGVRHPAIVKFNPGPARGIKWEVIPTYNNASVPLTIADTHSGGFADVVEITESGTPYLYACGIIRTVESSGNSERTPVIAKFHLSTGELVYFNRITSVTEGRFLRMLSVGSALFIAGEIKVSGVNKAAVYKINRSNGTLDTGFDSDGIRTYSAPGLPNEPTIFRDITPAPAVGSLGDGFVATGSVRLDNPTVPQPARDAFAVRAPFATGAADWSVVFSEASLGSLYTDILPDPSFCTNTNATQGVTTTEIGSEEGVGVRQMPDGNFAVVARFDYVELSLGDLPSDDFCKPFNTEQYFDNDVAVIKLSQTTGAPLYAINAGRSVAIDGWNPMVTRCNEIYICANTFNPPNPGTIYASVIRVDDLPTPPSGSARFDTKWQRNAPGQGSFFCIFGISMLEDGGLLLCGNNWYNGDDYDLMKFTNPDYGDITWNQGSATISGTTTWNTAKK